LPRIGTSDQPGGVVHVPPTALLAQVKMAPSPACASLATDTDMLVEDAVLDFCVAALGVPS
jgi:hypothetical protein